MTQVAPGVFVSDEVFASNLANLRRYNITHVLIVAKGCVAHFPDERITYLIKAIQDTPEQKIFPMFSPCCAFIEKARRRGLGVLIHCHAGLSRSVTFAAAYLMAKYRHSTTEALEIIREKIPAAEPNPGFIAQLQRLETYLAATLPPVAATAEETPPPGVPFSSSSVTPLPSSSSSVAPSPSSSSEAPLPASSSTAPALSSETASVSPVASAEIVATPTAPTSSDLPATDEAETSPETSSDAQPAVPEAASSKGAAEDAPLIPNEVTPRYRCRGCRYPLFGCEDIVPHVENLEYSFAKSRVKMQRETNKGQCHSYFVEQQEWMAAPPMNNLAEVEGKLLCPKCRYRLGYWAWNGAQCSCGLWITPAIQLVKSRVDEPVARSS